MLIYILLGLIVWTLFGYGMCVVNGYISDRQMRKYYGSKQEMHRDLAIRNCQETGSVDISDAELLFDAIFWPRTLVYAWRGQRMILSEMRKKQKDGATE